MGKHRTDDSRITFEKAEGDNFFSGNHKDENGQVRKIRPHGTDRL